MEVIGPAADFEFDGGAEAGVGTGDDSSRITQGMEQPANPETPCSGQHMGRVARAATADVVTAVEEDDRVGLRSRRRCPADRVNSPQSSPTS